MTGRILVVEDERDLARAVEYRLQKEGYSTEAALTGEAALARLAEDPLPDLVLLDLMLPDRSGIEICKSLRSDPRTRAVPVIMLTAKGEEIDRVVGFEVGTDDYLVKPFSLRELILRIRAVLRRAQAPVEPEAEGEFAFGRIRMDPGGHRTWVDGREVQLTALEFKLLFTLLKRRGRVQTRDSLLSDVWGIDADITTRTVDTHIKRLREKLGPAGEYIETLRGVGYRFRPKPEQEES
jgi:two-component system phosphate regulon response regulator PhoB